MPALNISPPPERSHPLATKQVSRTLIENSDNDSQAQDAFLQYLVVQNPINQHRNLKTINKNFSSSIGSIADRTPSSLFELKQQRLLAAADRKKRIIARIVSFVGLLIILLCAAIVTLTLKMAPKIDELVRTKVGVHQSINIISRMNKPATTIMTTIHQDNHTVNASVVEKFNPRTR